MKKSLFAGLLGGLLVAWWMPTPAMAQSAFDGTWKVDLSKVHAPKKPDVLLLQNGMYDCKTCAPAISIKADGTGQQVTGHPYFDMMAVKVVDDHTIQETDKKAGKVVATSTMTVAPDDKTATFEFTDSSNTNADPVTGKGTMMRVAKGPAGAHAISGSWRTTSYGNVSDNGLTFTYKVDGDSLSMTSPTGQSYSAKTDGTDAPYKGDPGTTSVSVKKLDKNTLQETDKRDGKVISIAKMTVAADGKTMTIAVNDKLRGTSMSLVAAKQ
ncbi:hypothetical protein [Rhodanobacter sp. C05]|uniref:hypothetical protein n=1 Tax=Rhodanobacter sp. C05 TaxID=1945855 RepID=UPI0020C4B400|nr:hypothetical protein [Rhodanobacter sp. C05]